MLNKLQKQTFVKMVQQNQVSKESQIQQTFNTSKSSFL